MLLRWILIQTAVICVFNFSAVLKRRWGSWFASIKNKFDIYTLHLNQKPNHVTNPQFNSHFPCLKKKVWSEKLKRSEVVLTYFVFSFIILEIALSYGFHNSLNILDHTLHFSQDSLVVPTNCGDLMSYRSPSPSRHQSVALRLELDSGFASFTQHYNNI